jgi:hypothetical protein
MRQESCLERSTAAILKVLAWTLEFCPKLTYPNRKTGHLDSSALKRGIPRVTVQRSLTRTGHLWQ